MGLGLMLVTSYIAKKRNYPVAAKRAFKEVGGSIKSGFLPLLTPLIMLGGIIQASLLQLKQQQSQQAMPCSYLSLS